MTFKSTILDNGLSVVTYSMQGVQSVAINVLINVGSRFESEEESGISHFLEHMAFKRTTNRSARQIAEEFDAIGGQFNAYTSKEHTTYYAKVLRENINTAFDILSDILQNSVFSSEDIEKEYNVICQEIAESSDNPDDLAYEKLFEVAFSNQALGRSILGTPETIQKFSQTDFQKYVKLHHNANNTVIAAAGNINHEEIVKFASDLFRFPTSNTVSYTKANYLSGVSLISKPLEQSTIVMGFKSVPYIDIKTFYHTQMLALILGGGISSRLFQNIREDQGLAYSVGSFNNSYADTGLFSLYAGTSHENVNKVAQSFIHEIHKLSDNIAETELIRAKAQIKASIIMAEEKTSYKSEEIGKNFAIFKKYDGPEVTISLINETTVKDIKDISEMIFASPMSLSVVSNDTSKIDYEKLKDTI